MNASIRRIIAGDEPVFLLIAGPNGASKSTYSEKRLKPLGLPCIDPDAVAEELFRKTCKDSGGGNYSTIAFRRASLASE